MSEKIKIIAFSSAVFLAASMPQAILAESYDLYVDKSYDGEEDGSSEKPFTKISEAIEKGGKGSKIYIRNGEYSESISLGQGMKIYGQDKKNTIIKGSSGNVTVTSSGNNLLKNLTVSGGSSGILAKGEIEIRNCIVKNAYAKGIDLAENDDEAIIDGNLLESNGKGVYAQKGRNIQITDNEIRNNAEEGIDIREKVSGKISGNSITGGKEGGIEFIVGSSDLVISGNSIKKNKASGLAAQFYPQAKKVGQIKISGNTISNNGQYGITCKSPSGGDHASSYWNDSLEVIDNKIENNKSKAIAGACKLIKAVSEEEDQKNQKIESEGAGEISAEENALKEEEEQKLAEEEAAKAAALAAKIAEERAQVASMRQIIEDRKSAIEKKMEETDKENGLKIFFVGHDKTKISALKDDLQDLRNKADFLAQPIAENLDESEKKALADFIRETGSKSAEYQRSLEAKENRFSLFGWIGGLWK